MRVRGKGAKRVALSGLVDARLKEAVETSIYMQQDVVGAALIAFLQLSGPEQNERIVALREFEADPSVEIGDAVPASHKSNAT